MWAFFGPNYTKVGSLVQQLQQPSKSVFFFQYLTYGIILNTALVFSMQVLQELGKQLGNVEIT